MGVDLARPDTGYILLLRYGGSVDLLNPFELIIILATVLRCLRKEVVARLHITHQWSNGLHVCSFNMR